MLLEGYLNKEEAGSSTRSVRWFQIDLVQHRLYYYKNKDKEELLGLLSLSDGMDFLGFGNFLFNLSDNFHSGRYRT